MTNINTIIQLDGSTTFNLIRACDYGGLHVLFTITNSQISSCYFVRGKDMENSSITSRTNSFSQCDIYHGRIQLVCPSGTAERAVLYLKGQLLNPISTTTKQIIHVSEAIKVNVLICENDSSDRGEIIGITPGYSQELHLTNVKMFVAGSTPYQLKDNAVLVLKSPPIYGDVFCEHKKVQIGDTVCKAPVYKLTGCGGILDTVSLEVLANADGASSSTILTMPIIVRRDNLSFKTMDPPAAAEVKKSVRMAMTESWITLSSKDLNKIEGAMYTLIDGPIYGGLYLGDTQIRSFRASHLDQFVILYRRNDKHTFDVLQDTFHLVICAGWPECFPNAQIIHVQIDMFPIEEKIIFRDILHTPSKSGVPVTFGQRTRMCGSFRLTFKPILGVLLLENVEIVRTDSKFFPQDRISYYRSEWNTSMDEFAFEQVQPPTIVVFRVITQPLIQFKTLHIIHGKEFVLDTRFLDISTLQASTERLKSEGLLKTSSSLKKALYFEFPQKTPVGRFFKSSPTDDKAGLLCFTYKELVEGDVKFQAFPNASIHTTSEGIKVGVFAPMFMAPQSVPIEITIISGQYNVQNNILLSDFVDESGSMQSQSDSSSGTPISRESESLKIWFATAIGIVCGIVCIFVTVAYFLLRRWRSKQRIQTRLFPNQTMHTDATPPKSAPGMQLAGQIDDQLSSPAMPVPLSAFEIGKAHPHAKVILSTDQGTSWSGQKSRWTAPSPTLCFLHAETAVQVSDECRHSKSCIFSQTMATSRALSSPQSSCKRLPLQPF
ncbi:hypothetical protein TcWFU_003969 [Taenia crassiceps]|uniref:Uncharacterized protein n=1 Tax=Taenia crassiceps TaxID=6207 RepID=A0ABR4QQP6_9CEST